MPQYHSRKYSVNEKFFDKWTRPMSYTLGFWFADGYMRIEKSYRFVIASLDRQILRDILSAMDSSHPVKTDTRPNCHFISICSKPLYLSLQRLGGRENKSLTIKWPSIPKQYLPDFVRGYFDGDGSVFYQTYKATKNNKKYTELRSNFTSGSEEFANALMLILNKEVGLPIKKLGIYNDGNSFKLGYGSKDTKKLLKYIYYPGFPIGLQRKAKFAKVAQ